MGWGQGPGSGRDLPAEQLLMLAQGAQDSRQGQPHGESRTPVGPGCAHLC